MGKKEKVSRENKMVARMIGKPKEFESTYGRTILNPIKRQLKGKPYNNPEFNEIMAKEVNMTIEMLKEDFDD